MRKRRRGRGEEGEEKRERRRGREKEGEEGSVPVKFIHVFIYFKVILTNGYLARFSTEEIWDISQLCSAIFNLVKDYISNNFTFRYEHRRTE